MSVDDVEVQTLPPLLATVGREKATKLFCPPTMWIFLLRHPDFDTRDLSSLRKGYYGRPPATRRADPRSPVRV